MAFVTSFPTNAMPVVGWQVRVDSGLDAGALADVDLMISQTAIVPSVTDVVAIGSIGGAPFRALYDPANAWFRSDADALHSLDDLFAGLGDSDALVFLAAPPGSGYRVALDHDLDCQLNAFDEAPRGSPDLNGDTWFDLTDLSLLLTKFGQKEVPRELGDVDGDGDADLSDLSLLLSVFGERCAP